MMPKQKNTFVIFAISILLIFVAIVAVSIINSQKDGAATDIRARAGVQGSIELSATVKTVDSTKGMLTVRSLTFTHEASSGTPLPGIWTVIAPIGFSYASVRPGSAITITVPSKSFDINSSTLSATKIQIVK